MSLSERKYRIGIIASKNFDEADWFEKRLKPNLDRISVIVTNGANPLVTDFALINGMICHIYPVNKNSAPWSNSRVIENSDKVFILRTPDSKNSDAARKECEKQGVKFEVIACDEQEFWAKKAKSVAPDLLSDPVRIMEKLRMM